MRKPIKIERDARGVAVNADLVAAWLAEANGRASRHTFTAWSDIEAEASTAESKLDKLGIPKAERAGAKLIAQSGSVLPNAYRYTARGTVITLLRRSSGWYLETVSGYDLCPKHVPGHMLHLTPEQDAKAIEVLRHHYAIQRPRVLSAAERTRGRCIA